MGIKESIYKKSPVFVQNIMISIFNYLAYRHRYGGNYKYYLNLIKENNNKSYEELLEIQSKRYSEFINYAVNNSPFYRKLYSDIENPDDINNISKLPILKKEDIRQNTSEIYTIDKKEGVVFKTGGTTGKSLEVLFKKDNIQERYGFIDNFRNASGYSLGKKTAWFSGKDILVDRDVKNKIFWKTDWLYKVRYYSTFHVKKDYLPYYLENIIKFKPEYMVGFPSTMIEIAKYGIQNKIEFPDNIIKAIYPTAETITDEIRSALETFYKAKVYDQYASSEGAPYIFECEKGKLHLELQSGVFEVLDENNLPAKSGKLVVTPFTTEGTPLIRYDIGDRILMSDDIGCECGNNNPIAEKILGRIDDYIYSPETGKINLGNISNTLKDTKGIVKFQVIQDSLNELNISLIIDKKVYNSNVEKVFLSNWKSRVGDKMKITLNFVDNIKVEKSGKYRLVKNNIKQLIEK